MALWIATLKPIKCAPVKGDLHRIRVTAASQDEAVRQVRFHAEIEGCGSYAITQMQRQDGRPS